MRSRLPTIQGIIVPDVCARAIDAAHRGIVKEKAWPPFQRIVDMHRRIPVRRVLRPGRIKGCRARLLKDIIGPYWRGQLWPPRSYRRIIHLSPILITMHPLLRNAHHEPLARRCEYRLTECSIHKNTICNIDRCLNIPLSRFCIKSFLLRQL